MNSFFRIPTLFLTFALSSILTSTVYSDQPAKSRDDRFQPSTFADHYTIIETNQQQNYREKFLFTETLLCKDSTGNLVTVKKYAVRDERFKKALEKAGTSARTFVEEKARHAWTIGKLIDHPNIIKTREAYFENEASYIVMEHVDGTTYYPEICTFTGRRAVMLQLLNIVEELLLQGILLEDIWSDHFIVKKEHLTLISFDNARMLGCDVSLGHYIYTIERMLRLTGYSSATNDAVDICSAYIPRAMREKPVATEHIPYLLTWFDALRKELVRFY